jgi:exopolysaccharide production protein ExoQ
MVLAGWRTMLRWPAAVPLSIATAVLLPLMAVFVSAFGGLIHALGRNTTLTDRTLIWQAVLALHANPWVGAGFESFWLGNRLQEVWHMSVNGIQEAHNGYLEIYLNLGWIGIVLLGGVIFTGLSRAIRMLHRDRQEGRLRIALLTAALIFSMTEAGFRMLSLMWLAFLFAASESPKVSVVREAKAIPGLSWMRGAQTKQLRILR